MTNCLKHKDGFHVYSRSMDQEYPRKCVNCGEPESVPGKLIPSQLVPVLSINLKNILMGYETYLTMSPSERIQHLRMQKISQPIDELLNSGTYEELLQDVQVQQLLSDNSMQVQEQVKALKEILNILSQ